MSCGIVAYDPSGPEGHLPIEDDGEEVIQTARTML
jgi:hypothetical protein